MCVTITYRCPRCETASGYRDHKKCDNGVCPGLVKLDRSNLARHFYNWFCANDACGYSRVAQAVDALEVEDILKAQAMGYTKPVLPSESDVPSKYLPTYGSRRSIPPQRKPELLTCSI